MRLYCWIVGAAAACAPATEAPGVAKPVAEPVAISAAEHFGAPFAGAPEVDLGRLLGADEAPPGHPVRVEGRVRRACTRRGCWLELATAMDEGAPGCRVILKDHAFFVPLDSAGASARIEGSVAVRTVPAEQVAHMESEGGQFANKHADGTATELRIVASGVELRRL